MSISLDEGINGTTEEGSCRRKIMIEKHCLSCHQDGHTYLECQSIDFFGLISCAAQLPFAVDKAKLAAELEKAARFEEYQKLKAEFEGREGH
jgi:hypothetical protein